MNTAWVTAIGPMRERAAAARQEGCSIACVPTMGSLHAGHGALIECARAAADVVVVTVFVNPIQFDQPEDYTGYMREPEADLAFCQARNVDVVFAPEVQTMYPEQPATFIETPDLSRHLCGAFRPGHFRGVATVVAKLLNIVQPDTAYFGEKDAQQLAVIERMVLDLNFPVRIVPVPTVREPDGLALSSRNRRLTREERRAAPVVFRALTRGQRAIAEGERDAGAIKRETLKVLQSEPSARVEYVEVVDARSMQPVERISGKVSLAAAVWFGATRLIDNVLCTE